MHRGQVVVLQNEFQKLSPKAFRKVLSNLCMDLQMSTLISAVQKGDSEKVNRMVREGPQGQQGGPPKVPDCPEMELKFERQMEDLRSANHTNPCFEPHVLAPETVKSSLETNFNRMLGETELG